MPRCLDCGAEFSSEQCDSCGLTPAVAQLLLRRRLLNRTAAFLLGALAFLPASHFFPPLELDAMLVFLGVITFVALLSAVWLDRRARQQKTNEPLKRFFYGLIPIPWLLASLLFVNGQFDFDPPVVHVTRVVGKFTMPGTLRSSRLVVLSWRQGRTIERIPISRDDYTRFQHGDTVQVRVQEGLVGIPWVNSVYHR